MKKIFLILALMLGMIIFPKCEKDQTFNDEITVEQISDDIVASIENAVIVIPLKSTFIDSISCPIRDFKRLSDTTGVIRIDFGIGCIGEDGNKRSGKMFILMLKEPKKILNIRLENYRFNRIKVDINFKEKKIKLTFPDGKSIIKPFTVKILKLLKG